MRWVGGLAAIVGLALAVYAATFLISAALVLFILGATMFAGGVWVFIQRRPHAEASQ
jgi:predicted phage tail protein